MGWNQILWVHCSITTLKMIWLAQHQRKLEQVVHLSQLLRRKCIMPREAISPISVWDQAVELWQLVYWQENKILKSSSLYKSRVLYMHIMSQFVQRDDKFKLMFKFITLCDFLCLIWTQSNCNTHKSEVSHTAPHSWMTNNILFEGLWRVITLNEEWQLCRSLCHTNLSFMDLSEKFVRGCYCFICMWWVHSASGFHYCPLEWDFFEILQHQTQNKQCFHIWNHSCCSNKVMLEYVLAMCAGPGNWREKEWGY